MICPNCENELIIICAAHHYSLTYSNEQEKWVKSVGAVLYSCGTCYIGLSVSDIIEALQQTDEI